MGTAGRGRGMRAAEAKQRLHDSLYGVFMHTLVPTCFRTSEYFENNYYALYTVHLHRRKPVKNTINNQRDFFIKHFCNEIVIINAFSFHWSPSTDRVIPLQ